MSDHIRDTDTPRDTDGPRPVATVTARMLSDKLLFELRAARERTASAKPNVEDVLRSEGLDPADVDPDLLTDLVYVEWMLRVEQGESPSRDEYRARFPMISPRLEKQWSLDQSLLEMSAEPSLLLTVPPTPPYLPTDRQQPGHAHRPTDAEQPGLPIEFTSIGKYKIISRLGAGGQAEVFRAVHPDLERDVVIKLLRPAWLANADQTIVPFPEAQAKRMIDEGRLLAKLSHPNVAQVYDIDRHLGCPFLVMEYVQGLALDQFQRTHPLDRHAAARLLASVARAVAAAHARGILHRDIKPQNIVVLNDGTPKLIDFGLAELADVWTPDVLVSGISGTISYMAPEQARGDVTQTGPASDIFSLGGVLFYLFTGGPPFHGNSWQEVWGRAMRCEWNRDLLASPRIPARLAAICSRAMAAEPADRFPTATELAQSLEAFASRPRRLRQSAAVVAVVLAVLATVWFSRPSSTAPRDTNPPATTASSPDKFLTPPQPAIKAALRILVHRDSATIELNDAVPLSTGDELSIESNIPAGLSMMLFAINGAGQLQHVASLPEQSTARHWRYPEAADSTVPLTGSAGTECLVVIGHSTGAISLEQINAAWGTTPDWPSLPPSTVLRLAGTDVIREQVGRDLGPPRSTGLRPADQVAQTLERFARQLKPQFTLVEGLAFSHIEPDE